jgi:hypothetical protein
MAISQLLVGVIGVTAGKNGDAAAVRCMVAFICINISMFAMAWGPAAWIIVGEIFPLPIRSRGVGLSTASNWFWNCVSCRYVWHYVLTANSAKKIIATITPYLVGTGKGDADLGAKVFFLWGSLCSLTVVFTYFLVPEMKGLSLEQIDKMLEETTPRKSASWDPHSTFASDMGLMEKGVAVTATIEDVHQQLKSV